MALMIPETIVPTAPQAEQSVFDLLRRMLPPECTVWHSSALELEPEQQVPFFLMGDEIGIVALAPLGWPPADVQQMATHFWQKPATPRLPPAQQAEMQTMEQHAAGLCQLLIESGLSELLAPGGGLRPAFHRVWLLTQFRSKEINQLNLRSIAPEALLLAADEIPQLYDILRQRTPPEGLLTGAAFNAARLVVSPSVEVRLRPRRAQTAEVDGQLHLEASRAEGAPLVQLTLDLHQEQVVKSFAHLPPDHEVTARDLDARLIRGVVGSGKSLILLHRAKFLSQLNPGWRVLVLTYNRSLADFLNQRLHDLPGTAGHIEVVNFHAWCRRFLFQAGLWRTTELRDHDRKGMLRHLASGTTLEMLNEDPDYVVEELDWIRDQGLTQREQYAKQPRRGRRQRLAEGQRRQVWDLLVKFQEAMRANKQFDWTEVPLMMLAGIAQGKIPAQQYHAVLVDEAQDFAPSWFAVIQQMLKPTTNMLFIVSDGAQKIYRRSLSWRTLGIDISGHRSRVLNRSYRNTYEILRVAYELVGNDPTVREELQSEGDEVIKPEMDGRQMRRGPTPVLLQFADPAREQDYIASEIRKLVQSGLCWEEIAIFQRDVRAQSDTAAYLRSRGIPAQIVKGRDINLSAQDVKLLTLHSSKGLEFSVVFVAGTDRLQPRPGLTGEELAAEIAEERRLLYVGMTRARDLLYITHTGPLPIWATAALAMAERRPASSA